MSLRMRLAIIVLQALRLAKIIGFERLQSAAAMKWLLNCVGVDGAARHFFSVASSRLLSSPESDSHNLLGMASVVCLHPEVPEASKLEDVVNQRLLTPVTGFLAASALTGEPRREIVGEFQRFVDAEQFPNLGPIFARQTFQSIGVVAKTAPWAVDARQQFREACPWLFDGADVIFLA